MPLIRRLPKRGFSNVRHAVNYVPVNLSDLNRFESGSTVGIEALRKAGLANGTAQRIKILGDGKLEQKLTVQAHAFSASAKAKIEEAGGSCEVVKKEAAAGE